MEHYGKGCGMSGAAARTGNYLEIVIKNTIKCNGQGVSQNETNLEAVKDNRYLESVIIG